MGAGIPSRMCWLLRGSWVGPPRLQVSTGEGLGLPCWRAWIEAGARVWGPGQRQSWADTIPALSGLPWPPRAPGGSTQLGTEGGTWILRETSCVDPV